MQKSKAIKIIISGGGTGGHVFPALAIADALKEKNENIDILFVGAKGKLEMDKVPKAGYRIIGLWISGIQRKLSLKNLLFPFKVISSLWTAGRILKSFKPDVVVGVGGYASYPTLSLAKRFGIPVLVNEQNSYAGLSNKMLKSKADKFCVAYEGMEKYFPAEKIILTGNPIRQDIQNSTATKTDGIMHFGLSQNKKTIVLVGGSLGARSLNDSMAANEAIFKANENVQILWQAGKLYIEEFKKCNTAQLPNVKVQAFIDRMDLAYAMADVLICRAGALTISELTAVGKPAVLVPSPNVAEDHQTMNAKALVKRNAAVLVKDQNVDQMVQAALNILKDQSLSDSLSRNIKEMALPNAAAKIADEVLQLIKK